MIKENCHLPEINGAYIDRELNRLDAVIVMEPHKRVILIPEGQHVGLKSWRVIDACCRIFELRWIWIKEGRKGGKKI